MKKIFLVLSIISIVYSCDTQKKATEKMESIVDLSQNTWQFKSTAKHDWMPATVPGTVHADLLANDSITDPFFRFNAKQLQWIDNEDWEYKTEFLMDGTSLESDIVELTFEGLGTYADVFLNDRLILQTKNMFRTYKVDVSNPIISGLNDLHLIFYSPANIELKHLKEKGFSHTDSINRVENGGMEEKNVNSFIHEEPHRFGWNLGSRLVPLGIWKPVYFTIWNKARINDLYVKQLNINSAMAEIEIQTEIEADNYLSLSYKIIDIESKKVLDGDHVDLEPGKTQLKNRITLYNPNLWWPNGYGDQNFYNFRVEIYIGNVLLAYKEVKTGLRSIKVMKEPIEKVKSFSFEVNGVPVIAKDTNYIPNDKFVTKVSTEKYSHILQSAVDANMNMVRVWGGGIYEYDKFYDLCDSLGLMIWHDFMFTCNMYPDKDDFIESVRLEAIDNVKRLRNHPSIALWCGNNEIEADWAVSKEKLGLDRKELYNAEQRQAICKAYDTLFYNILPEVVEQNHSNVFYWPSLPAANFRKLAGDENSSGNMH